MLNFISLPMHAYSDMSAKPMDSTDTEITPTSASLKDVTVLSQDTVSPAAGISLTT